MKKTLPLAFTLPILTLATGTAVLLVGYWDHRRDVDEVENLFEAHVDSVAQLIKEGAREASASTSLIYDLTEDHLVSLSQALPSSPSTLIEPLLVRISVRENTIDGHFASVPEADRKGLVDWMMSRPLDHLIDDGPLRRLGLACILRKTSDAAFLIVCRDAEELSMLRKEIGIGPLLKGVIKGDVLYVALQDSEGILSVAPSQELVSRWRDDPFLAATLSARPGSGTSRLRRIGEVTVFEGVIPFVMADESTVLLRVGIDAAPLMRIRRGASQRFVTLIGLVLGIFLFSLLVALLLRRWHRKQTEMSRIIEAEEKRRHHWETIGQMAATVAHEVRNPLNTISMVTQRMAQEFHIDDDERREFEEMLGVLSSESRRVGRFITEFLDLGKPLLLNREAVPVKDAVQEVLFPLTMRAEEENKTLEMDYEGDDIIVVDRHRFRQMLTNLVSNALDAVDGEGKVAVRPRAVSRGISIEVSDNGSGMTDQQLAEVMKPFVSYKSTGTGLGLPLVARIAEVHGGAFELSSNPGTGTVATVFIPASAEHEGRSQ